MRVKHGVIRVNRAFGLVVEGEAAVSKEGFSPRYDLEKMIEVLRHASPRGERNS